MSLPKKTTVGGKSLRRPKKPVQRPSSNTRSRCWRLFVTLSPPRQVCIAKKGLRDKNLQRDENQLNWIGSGNCVTRERRETSGLTCKFTHSIRYADGIFFSERTVHEGKYQRKSKICRVKRTSGVLCVELLLDCYHAFELSDLVEE
jgi:hypothetical protein